MKTLFYYFLIFAFFFQYSVKAGDLPSGDNVVAGSVNISTQDTSMIIDQSSNQAIIEWQSFDIGQNNSVTFNQPSINAGALNRVISGDPTTLAGSLSANGNVFVINENGVYFTTTATISANSFAASTLALSNDDYLQNKLQFYSDQLSESLASVINKGFITTLDGGFTALLGGAINNEGTISANLGKVGIGVGQEIILDLSGDKFLQVAVPIDEATTVFDENEEEVNMLIKHSGTTKANNINLNVGSAKNLLARAVNIPGDLIATSASQKDGVITLGGGGSIVVAGNLSAKENSNINISGDFVSLGGTVDVSGASAGSISIKSEGETSLSAKLNASSTNDEGGKINITSSSRIVQSHGSLLNVSGQTSGGTIQLSSKDFISSGDIEAKGHSLKGGFVDIEASNDIRLLSSSIDVSGNTQGGLIRVGGDFQGGNNLTRTSEQEDIFVNRWGATPDIINAQKILISDGSKIDISGSTGPGGTAIIWSDKETTMLGDIKAKGTIGGAVEISSKDTLRHVGLSKINISEGGHLLLDPKNITVGDAASSQNWIYRGLIGFDYVNTATNDSHNAYLRKADHFGSAITINDTNTLLAVGARLGDGNSDSLNKSGDVYLYQFDDSDFTNATLIGRIGKGYSGSKDLDITTLSVNDRFGRSLSFDSDGDRLAVGVTGDDGTLSNRHTVNVGAVYLISFDDTSYSNPTLQGKIGQGYTGSKDIDLGSVGVNSGTAWGKKDMLGMSVALDGDGNRLAVGASGDEGWNRVKTKKNSGSVFLFTFSDTSFSGGELVGRMGYGYNYSTSPSCVTAGTCATFEKDFDTSDSSNWTLGTHDAHDGFGRSVSLYDDGSLLSIGAFGDDGYSATANHTDKKNYGAVHLFKFSDTSFSSPEMIGTIGSGYTGTNNVNASLATNEYFGTSVSIDSDANRMAVGLLDHASDEGTNKAGGVHLYSFSSTNSFTGASLEGTIGSGYEDSKDVDMASYLDAGDHFGHAVALDGDGNRLVVGAIGDDGSIRGNPGAIYMFKFDDTSYTNGSVYARIGKGYTSSGGSNLDLDTATADSVTGSDDSGRTYLEGDGFGRGVALDGDGNRLAVVANREDGLNNSNSDTGAVYLITFDDDNFTNPTLKGMIGSGYSGDYSLDLGVQGDHMWRIALDGDGDRLVFSQLYGRSGARNTGSVYTIKFDDTDFTNPQHVGTLGYSYSGDNDLSISTLDNTDKFGRGLSLNNDGSRLVVGNSAGDGSGNAAAGSGDIYLISFSDANFSSPSLTGTIGIDYTGDNDLDLSSDASTSANRILAAGDGLGNHLSLTNDGTKLAIGASTDDGADDSTSNKGAVHLFTFSDGDFSSPTYVGSIGNAYTYGKSYDTSSISDWEADAVSFDGDGTRLAIGDYEADDVRMFGFSDTSLSDAELKFTIGYDQTGTNELDISSSGLGAADSWSNAISMDDYGRLLVVGAELDDGYSNAKGNSGSVSLWSDTILAGATSYTDFSSDDIVINATELKELLNDNVNVTLQANTDITINSALTVTGSGSLNLHAGRDVDINKTIDTAGNLQIIASDTAEYVVDAQRDSGAADILAAYESDGSTAISLTAADLDLQLRDGSGITNVSMGNVELATVTATTGSLQSANFSASGTVVADKTYDGTTSATITTNGSVSGLTLVGSDLSLSRSAEFLTAAVGSDKDVSVEYQLAGFTSSDMAVLDASGNVEETVTADIVSSAQNNDTGVQEEESEDKIVIKEKVNKGVFDDLSRIVSFISVDGASNAALLQQQIIKSFVQVDAMSIQSL